MLPEKNNNIQLRCLYNKQKCLGKTFQNTKYCCATMKNAMPNVHFVFVAAVERACMYRLYVCLCACVMYTLCMCVRVFHACNDARVWQHWAIERQLFIRIAECSFVRV